jgi:hypothetical protein
MLAEIFLMRLQTRRQAEKTPAQQPARDPRFVPYRPSR